jgi:hypothetical protein
MTAPAHNYVASKSASALEGFDWYLPILPRCGGVMGSE